MRAVGFTRYGGSEVVEVVDVPTPEPGEEEIRIRVTAATLNPADTMFRDGGLAAVIEGDPPYVPGLELAGVVDAVGPRASWKVGDRVAAMTKFIPAGRGAHAEFVVVHGESAAAIPDGLSDAEAATVPMNGLTVRQGLDRLGLKAGQWLAVTGAVGAIGGYAVQLGAADGLRVVGIASPKDEATVRELGAEAFVARGDDAGEGVRAIVPGGVDGLIDAARIGAPILPAVRDGGSVAVLRPFEGEPERGIEVDLLSVRTYLREPAKLKDLMDRAADGRLTTRVADTFAPERARDAHARLDAGGVRGRLVLTFD